MDQEHLDWEHRTWDTKLLTPKIFMEWDPRHWKWRPFGRVQGEVWFNRDREDTRYWKMWQFGPLKIGRIVKMIHSGIWKDE